MTLVASDRELDLEWMAGLQTAVPEFLSTLHVGDYPGRYLPCKNGATTLGREMMLGWSCFALKTFFMLGLWDGFPPSDRANWIRLLQSYQKNDGENSFIDPPEAAFLETYVPWRERLRQLFRRTATTKSARAITLAETKQTIATLAEVNAEPLRTFSGFPQTPEAVRIWLESQNWTRPWGAGGQSAGLIVFIKTQGPKLMAQRDVDELLRVCSDFYKGLADRETGAYFKGARPAHGEMINGAMKVLMALDWLGDSPHYPDQLVATTLKQPPSPKGCHLVDAVYVLHQCLNQREPEKAVREFCGQIFAEIKLHSKPDGGFSFDREKAQTVYYGVPVSRGLPESDIQGTCLLVWALALICRLLSPASAVWRPMKP